MNGTFITSFFGCCVSISIQVDIHILCDVVVIFAETLLAFAAIRIEPITKVNIVQGMLVKIVGGVFAFVLFGCVWCCDRCRFVCIGRLQFSFYFGRWFIESTFIDTNNTWRMRRCRILDHIKRLNANTETPNKQTNAMQNFKIKSILKKMVLS